MDNSIVRNPSRNTSKALVDTRATSVAWDLLRQALRQTTGKCLGCYVFPDRAYDHQMGTCPKGIVIETWMPALRRRLHFPKDSCCFKCLLPKRECDARYNGTRCEQPLNGILGIALAMHLYQKCTPGFFRAEGYPLQRLGHDIGEHDIGVFATWGAVTGCWAGEPVVNLVRIVGAGVERLKIVRLH